MSRSVDILLGEILMAIDLLRQYTAGMDFAAFRTNVEKQDSVVRRLEIIGEAVKGIPVDVRAAYPEVLARHRGRKGRPRARVLSRRPCYGMEHGPKGSRDARGAGAPNARRTRFGRRLRLLDRGVDVSSTLTWRRSAPKLVLAEDGVGVRLQRIEAARRQPSEGRLRLGQGDVGTRFDRAQLGDDGAVARDAERLAAYVGLLEAVGLRLSRPYADTLRGSSVKNLKELRVQHRGQPYRVLYAFDPRREAVLLVGGTKAGDGRWYSDAIPRAEAIYARHLADLENDHGG